MYKPSNLLLVFLVVMTTDLSSQAGVLDSTFSQDGVDFLDMGSLQFDLAFAGAIQPDGKILAGGWTTENIIADFAVARYLENGDLDAEFGVNGVAIIDNMGNADRANTIIQQPDGKIIMVGESYQGIEGDICLLRLMPDGSPDSTFGQFGWVTSDLGTNYETVMAAALQSDGKIVVGGRVADGNFSNFVLLRYHPNGMLDSLFGDNGVVVTDFREEDAVTSLLLKPDGKIIAGGYSSVSAIGDFALACYYPDGSLDKAFGNGGKVLTNFVGSQSSDYIAAMALLPDGKILAGGTANNSNQTFTSEIGLARYDGLGNLDETFGDGGTYRQAFGSRSSIDGMAVQVDGRIVVSGKSDLEGGENKWLLARMLPDGGLDTTFANQGITTLVVGGLNSAAQDVALQQDGKIILVGYVGQSPDVDFGVARYTADFSVQFSAQEITCYGENEGSIMVEVDGGTSPYSYSLDNLSFQSDPLFTNLPAGEYLIWIQDAAGSSMAVGPIIVEQPEMPNVELVLSENDVTVNVLSGGVPPYMYSVDGKPFIFSNMFENLSDGEHTFLVRDGIGCILFEGVLVVMSTGLISLDQNVSLQIYPNPNNGIVTVNVGSLINESVNVEVYDMFGRIVFRERSVNPANGSFPLELSSLHDGVYILRVSDSVRFGTARIFISH